MFARAVDAAIARENARFLANPREVLEAELEGMIYRERLEADGTLPPICDCGKGEWCPEYGSAFFAAKNALPHPSDWEPGS